MQDKYVGDIGDYGKFGLLRFLLKECPEISIGINWYYVGSETDTGNNSDGRFVEYQEEEPKYLDLQKCDPDLIEVLKRIVSEDRRKVSELIDEDIVPGATYYADLLKYSSPSDLCQNERIRNEWFDNSTKTLGECDVIFTDADNGVLTDRQVNQKTLYSRNGIKYIGYDEIAHYYCKMKKSVIVYNHHSREKQEKYLRKFTNIMNKLQVEQDRMDVLTFSKCSGRDYIFIIQERHECIKKALDEFKKSSWCTMGAFNQKNWKGFQQMDFDK
jgi:hypothetical protein